MNRPAGGAGRACRPARGKLIITAHRARNQNRMLQQWREFLEARGASFSGDAVTGFAGPAADADTDTPDILADLGPRGILAVSGADAGRFLQGQLTCNVDEVTAEHSTLGACCTNKGRMVSSFRMLAATDGFLLGMHRELVARLRDHLQKFSVFYKAEMSDASDRILRIGCAGPRVGEALGNHFSSLPDSVNQVVRRDGNVLVRVHGNGPRYEAWIDADTARQLWDDVAAVAQPVSWNEWLLGEIASGVAFVAPETCEEFLPQMLNYHAVDGISFNKGCYTGQEIVARMQYRGNLKRTLHRVVVRDTSEAPVAGTPVFASGHAQAVGTFAVAALRQGLGAEGLCVIQRDSAEAGGLHAGSPDGPALKLPAP